jgi:polyhydroxyalkanoate synthase
VRRLRNLANLLTRKQPRVGETPATVVHRENKWSLLRYRARDRGLAFDKPILMVPSLINRHYVLDLTPGKSFVEWLVDQGHDVYMIDWGTPTSEDRYLSFDDICDRYIGRALRIACRRSGASQAHLMGYCLGGTLATIHAAARPDRVASLTNLAAPIGFDDDGLLAKWTRVDQFDVPALVEATGLIPWPLMQAAFHMLKPTLGLSKTIGMIDRAWDDEFLDGFLAIEKWGNDNVSFPGACYQRYINELYRRDALLRGDFTLSGDPVRLEAIECPVLAVTFEHDHIVPWRSAAVLLNRISSQRKRQIHLPGGHVGAVVSRKASKSLWPELSQWWAQRQLTEAPTGRAADAA